MAASRAHSKVEDSVCSRAAWKAELRAGQTAECWGDSTADKLVVWKAPTMADSRVENWARLWAGLMGDLKAGSWAVR
jgi:hypothetical protein